jgi:NitT/TauT family transport system permease protein
VTSVSVSAPRSGRRRGDRRTGAETLSVILERGVPPLVTAVVLIGAWQLCVATGLLGASVVSEPSQIAVLLWHTLQGQQLFGASIWTDLGVTIRAIIYGYLIGTAFGIVLGYLLARVDFVAQVFQPYVEAIAALPKIALVPLFVFIFGIGITAEMVNAALMVFIIVLFSTFSGVASAPEQLVAAARVMGAGRWTVTSRVVLPAALPSVLVGMRAGVSFAFVGAITSEFIAATSGLGWMMQQATAAYDTEALFTGLIYLVVLVWLLAQVIGLLQAWLLRWQRG